jgi:hypothetical protein
MPNISLKKPVSCACGAGLGGEIGIVLEQGLAERRAGGRYVLVARATGQRQTQAKERHARQTARREVDGERHL